MSIQHSIRWAVEHGTDNSDKNWSGTDRGEPMWGGGGNDTFYGLGGNDVLLGSGGNDLLYGNSGKDYLYGGDQKDHLFGGSGNDYLDGGDGDDWISGGTGPDRLIGGAGHDTFEITKESFAWYRNSVDTIQDFSAADKLELHSLYASLSNFHRDQFDGRNEDPAVNFETAMYKAIDDFHASGEKHQYIFYSDMRDGYLFADTDHNGKLDTAVVLEGLDSKYDLSWNQFV